MIIPKIKSLLKNLFPNKKYDQIYLENQLLRQEIIQSEKFKSIAILASGIAHEIKNPLTPLKTFAEHLPNKLDDKEFLIKFSKIIIREVDRIDALLHEMLDFAKPSPPILKPVRIHELINSTLDILNNEVIKNHIKVARMFEIPFDIELSIDHKQMRQALLNILMNAIEAMPIGGKLTIKTHRHHIKKQTTISISDTGLGIHPNDIPYIFDPFFSKKDHGTGLGLSITHEIIKNHGGKIYIESEINKGTRFIIELPD